MSKEYIKAQTPLPAYFPYPKFLLQMSLSHTARLTYVLLLDRMTLSQKNGWVDVQGRAYVLYPLAGLAEELQSSISSVTRALRELEAARLIERRSNGFSKPNQIFLGVPRTAQKCAIEMAQNEQPDCSKVSNELNNAFSGRNEVVDRLCGYPLLVIDDFGMERGTEYALEQIYNIIDSRYRSRKPLIVTTNLTLTELKNPQDTTHARIYDRLLELCTPIACTGPSMRTRAKQCRFEAVW